MKQVIIGGSGDTASNFSTEYNRLHGGHQWDATETEREQLVSTSGTFTNLRVELDGVVTTGEYVFTIRVNGASPGGGLTTTITSQNGSDTVNSVSVVAGDRICIESHAEVPFPELRSVRWTIEFEGDTTNESLLLGGTEDPLSVSAIEYNQLTPTTILQWTTSETRMQQVIPTAGKIKNLYVRLNADPGTDPDRYRFTLRLDTGGGLTNTALTLTITADDTTGNNTADEITVAAGDLVTLKVEPLSIPAVNPKALWGMTFVADTDGESLILGGSPNSLHSTATEYLYLTGGGNWNATEASRIQLGQVCTLKKLYVELENAPGAGNSYTFKTRINTANGNLSVAIADLAKTGNDTGNTDVLSNDDNLSFQSVPVSSPVESEVYWGLVSFIEPSVAGIANKSANMGAKMIAGGLI